MEQTNNYRRPRRSNAEQNRSAQGYWLAILLIVFIVLLDLLAIFSPDRSFSDNENRKLAVFLRRGGGKAEADVFRPAGRQLFCRMGGLYCRSVLRP